jgi:hypothetical protein
VFQPKNNSRCHRRRGRRRTLPLRPIKKTTIKTKTTEPHIPEPSSITDQERRTKLEALQRARAEKTAHILEQLPEQQTQENNDDDDDDDEAIDKELEIVQQKIQ